MLTHDDGRVYSGDLKKTMNIHESGLFKDSYEKEILNLKKPIRLFLFSPGNEEYWKLKFKTHVLIEVDKRVFIHLDIYATIINFDRVLPRNLCFKSK